MRQSWGTYALVIFAALGALSGGGVLWWHSAQQEAGHRAFAAESAKIQHDATSERISRECAGSETEAESCEAKIEAESRKAQQEIFDLEAQRTMAVWTRAMGIATIVGVAIAILTLGFIFLTLRATQRAAAYSGVAARQASRSLSHIKEATAKELRPYVAIADKDEAKGQPFNRQSTMTFIVKNFGQTPATNVRLSIGDTFRHEPLGEFQVPLGEKFGDYGLLAPGDFRTESIGAENLKLEELADMFARDHKLVIRIRIDYEWPGGNDCHDITLVLHDPAVSQWTIVDERRRLRGRND